MQHINGLFTLVGVALGALLRNTWWFITQTWPVLLAISALVWLIGPGKTTIVVSICAIFFALALQMTTPIRNWWRERRAKK